jgi:hypothetical protein
VQIPTIRSIISPDLAHGDLPRDPDDCSVLIEAEIGPAGLPGADVFSFQAVTPKYLTREALPRWGRGLLIVKHFSWREVEASLQKLLMHAARSDWSSVAAELAKELHWEFEGYSTP